MTLKDYFFDHLAELSVNAQFVVLENVDPPENIEALAELQVYGGRGGGRQGLFP